MGKGKGVGAITQGRPASTVITTCGFVSAHTVGRAECDGLSYIPPTKYILYIEDIEDMGAGSVRIYPNDTERQLSAG